RAQLLGVLETGRIGVRHHLRDAVMIAQVDEQHSAMVADAVAPAGKPHLLADVAGAQNAAGMGAIAVHGDDLTLDAARKGTRAGLLVKNGKAMMAGRWRSGARGCDSERLSPGRDRRRHPRQVQRRSSCLRERKITLPTDLLGGALGMQGAAPFSGGEAGARGPGRVERTGYDHAEGDTAQANDEIPRHSRLLFPFVRRVRLLVGHVPRPVQTWLVRGVGSPMIRAGGLDSAPPICTLARFEVRAS